MKTYTARIYHNDSFARRAGNAWVAYITDAMGTTTTTTDSRKDEHHFPTYAEAMQAAALAMATDATLAGGEIEILAEE